MNQGLLGGGAEVICIAAADSFMLIYWNLLKRSPAIGAATELKLEGLEYISYTKAHRSLLISKIGSAKILNNLLFIYFFFTPHTFLLMTPIAWVCALTCVCDIRRGYGNGGREGPDGPTMKSAGACLYQLQLSLSLQWNRSTPEAPKSYRRPTHNIVLNGTKKINTQCKWKAGE